MLSVFIIKSGSELADSQKTIDSFKDLNVENVKEIGSVDSLHDQAVCTEYYMVMFDDEVISPGMRSVMPVYLRAGMDVIECFKIQKSNGEDKVTFAPRIFKHNIKPRPGTLIPDKIHLMTITRMLDGWIYQNDYHSGT